MKQADQNFNNMDVNTKINVKANLFCYLQPQQAAQLIERNLIALAPYYGQRLRRQAEEVYRAEQFKAIYGVSRYEYENNINR